MSSRRSKKLSRRRGTRALLPRVLVVCEGKTEKQLLCELRGHYRIPSVSVELLGQVGVPKTIVEKAKKEAKDFDEVWVVFDRDEHPGWNEALGIAKRHAMSLAVSNPCFEIWGILLHQEQNSYINHKKAQGELAQLHPKYHHKKNPYLDLECVLKHKTHAQQRAESLLKSRADDNDLFGNPSTRFHLLVDRLSELGSLSDGTA